MAGALTDVRDFLSGYLDCDIDAAPPHQVTVVLSKRRTSAELNYADVFAVWALVLPDRAVMSVQAGLGESVKRIVDRYGLAGVAHQHCVQELEQLVGSQLESGLTASQASGVFHYCSRDTLSLAVTRPCRPATAADLQPIRHLNLYERWLERSIADSTCFVALDDDQPVAICGTYDVPHLTERIADIGLPGTAQTHRRRGYGTAVLAATTRAATERGMTPVYHTSTRNHASIATARSVGYHEFGRDYQIRIRSRS